MDFNPENLHLPHFTIDPKMAAIMNIAAVTAGPKKMFKESLRFSLERFQESLNFGTLMLGRIWFHFNAYHFHIINFIRFII